jgi:hypothetical protein
MFILLNSFCYYIFLENILESMPWCSWSNEKRLGQFFLKSLYIFVQIFPNIRVRIANNLMFVPGNFGIAWSQSNANQNRWMTSVGILKKMVGCDFVPVLRIAIDLPHMFVFFEFETYSFSWPPSFCCYLNVVNVFFAFDTFSILLGFYKWGLILCPNDQIAEFLHADYVQVGGELIFFDQVRCVIFLP